MTANAAAPSTPATAADRASARNERPIRSGWITIAGKGARITS